MSKLLIRPGRNDHRVVEDLLVAGGGIRRLRPVINRLVLDAPVASSRPSSSSTRPSISRGSTTGRSSCPRTGGR